MTRQGKWRTVCTAGVVLLGLMSWGAGCSMESLPVSGDCGAAGTCQQASPLSAIEHVDILLVLDSSGSMLDEDPRLRAELAALTRSLVIGQSDDDGARFARAADVHLAITTADMGVPGVDLLEPSHCEGVGTDGVLVPPIPDVDKCPTSPGRNYLEYDLDNVEPLGLDPLSCIPTLTAKRGCGFQMPLEAALKAVWPASRPDVTFLGAQGARTLGHGDGANAGFLRDDSLLVVVVITDEDDCSSQLTDHLQPPALVQDSSGPTRLPNGELDFTRVSPDLRCYRAKGEKNADGLPYLRPVEAYVDAFSRLRPGNDRFIFTVLAGVPTFLVDSDLSTVPEVGTEHFYQHVLADAQMIERIDQLGASLSPACSTTCESVDGSGTATPPRRLVRAAAGFGEQGVLDSVCVENNVSATGNLLRAIAARLNAG